MFAFLEHWQVQLFADEVVLTTEFFQFSLCDMELSTFFHADAVDDEVGVDMLPIHMGADVYKRQPMFSYLSRYTKTH